MPQLRVTFAKDAKLGANEEEIPQIVLRAPTNELHSAPDAGQAQQARTTDSSVDSDHGDDDYSESWYDAVATPDGPRSTSPSQLQRSLPPREPTALLGLANGKHHGFEAREMDRGVEYVGDHSDWPEVVSTRSDARGNPPTHPSILGLREPGIDEHDTDHIKYHVAPLPSETVNSDRGEGDWNASAQKQQIQSDATYIPSGDGHDTTSTTSFNDLLTEAMVHRQRQSLAGFMPRGELERLVNVVTVERELINETGFESFKGRPMRDWAKQICGELSSSKGVESGQRGPNNGKEKKQQKTYRKIFALVVLHPPKKLGLDVVFDLLEEDVSDQDLPLHRLDPASNNFELRRRKGGPDRTIRCLSGWGPTARRNFYREQWAMLSPYFARGDNGKAQHYQLDDEDLLPFTYNAWDEASTRGNQESFARGGFGEVFKVRIHRDHHGFHDDVHQSEELDFAVKRLFSTDEAEWRKEIEILKRLSTKKHNHLISLLATYEHMGRVHLLFHWADGDLQRYWKTERTQPKMDTPTVHWVVQQCHGIASGVAAIHHHHVSPSPNNRPSQPPGTGTGTEMAEDEGDRDDKLYGRHGDIKPRNILWFKNRAGEGGMGTLVITDFGVAEMNSIQSRSGKSNRQLAYSRTYCAPEAYIKGCDIRRSYDIWTLGCLYLEFLAWLLGGWPLLYEFVERRLKPEMALDKPSVSRDWFFELETSPGDPGTVVGARVKEEVAEFIQDLHSHTACTDLIHDFLDLIQDHLLIVETRDSERRRFTSGQVVSELWRLQAEVASNWAYGLEPKPWGPDGRPHRANKPPDLRPTASDGCPGRLSKRSTL